MMDFEFTEEEQAFREEVEKFALSEMPPEVEERTYLWPGGYGTLPIFEKEFEEFCRNFLLKLGKRGWLSLGWPERYGGVNSIIKQTIVDDVLSYHRAPFGSAATFIVAPTLIRFGSDEMKDKWMPGIISGTTSFWLGYSEPDVGSDLSSVKTTAVKDGNEYVINGQKIWSSGAHVTDCCWLLAKTDDTSKHKGMSLFIVDNNTPGITIRPITNIAGVDSFNEVFFDDVRVPEKNLVGEENKGFYYVMSALEHERIKIGFGTFRRILDELTQYVKEKKKTSGNTREYEEARNIVASMAIEVEILKGFFWRTVWMMDNGFPINVEASALKLFCSELGVSLSNAAVDILGLYGQLDKGSKWTQFGGRAGIGYLDSISGPIGAGSSEIQRVLIATSGLGLPRR
ncbi:MAG: acyl-CoA dehydrogenase [Desulfobacterales bacterium]|jgi:3-oxocholest-4-en-26-oyl-CoA dehydrogenase alpha subunit|nr:acyl-CoA dehydrogenase [Desulfobacteraceae bacterium]MBT4363927.1 acyl-CoA dehydrogenase [Desulfobacteraceae bacterium]MBT7087168.1 acyl-CoA dehydrogenase [Desulfobacterales bacterium]